MIQTYLDLISPEHKGQPNLEAWLTAVLGTCDDAQDLLTELVSDFDIDSAIGLQLDAIGSVLGISRTLDFTPVSGSSVLSDDNYRFVLKAKIMGNQWDGTRLAYEAMVVKILCGKAVLVDNSNMTLDVALILDASTTYLAELLQNGYLLPTPAGVKVNFAAPLKATWDWYYYQYSWDYLYANYTWDSLAL